MFHVKLFYSYLPMRLVRLLSAVWLPQFLECRFVLPAVWLLCSVCWPLCCLVQPYKDKHLVWFLQEFERNLSVRMCGC